MARIINEKPFRHASTIIQWRASSLTIEKNEYRHQWSSCTQVVQDVDTFISFLCHIHSKDDEQKMLMERTKKWKIERHKNFKTHYIQKKMLVLFHFVQWIIDNSFDLWSRTDPFFENVDQVFETHCTLQNNIALIDELCHDDDALKLQSYQQHTRGLISLAALCMHYAHSEIFIQSKTRSQIVRFYTHVKLIVSDLKVYMHFQPDMIDEQNISMFENDMKHVLYK